MSVIVLSVKLRLNTTERKLLRLYAKQKSQTVDSLVEAFALDLTYHGLKRLNVTSPSVLFAHTWLDTRFLTQKRKR